jgi:hypothetical protein
MRPPKTSLVLVRNDVPYTPHGAPYTQPSRLISLTRYYATMPSCRRKIDKQ